MQHARGMMRPHFKSHILALVEDQVVVRLFVNLFLQQILNLPKNSERVSFALRAPFESLIILSTGKFDFFGPRVLLPEDQDWSHGVTRSKTPRLIPIRAPCGLRPDPFSERIY